MNTLTVSANSYSPSTTLATIVAAIVRSLRIDVPVATGTETSGSAATNDALAKLASILNLLLNPSLNPRNGAALMDINLDQLVSNSALQNLIRQLPPELLSRPQVFEALVLQNALLPNTSAAVGSSTNALPINVLLANPQQNSESAPTLPMLLLSQTPNASPQQATTSPQLYRITLEWQNRLLQILSPQPFTSGTRLQLQTNAQGQLTLLSSGSAAAVAQTPNALVEPVKLAPQTPLPQIATPLQTLQQSARELLPKQQALNTLVPLLQKLLQPAQSNAQATLPQPVVKALLQLLQSLPLAEQLQNPVTLRVAVENSGSFLENRIARAQLDTAKLPNVATAKPEALAKLATTDIKAQISALLEVIRKFIPNTPTMARTPAPIDTDDLVYSHKPAMQHNTAQNIAGERAEEPADSTLTQLSKLLQSGLARIQLNQLDSASARHASNDTQPPVPTWIVEVPVRTPFGADNVQLRIEQRFKKLSNRMRQQWNVHIALDLHAAGKLTASLAIVEKSVSATLWAEHEQTHRAVRDEMDFLRAGLESVGVTVTEMQCRHGVAPARTSPLTQRLVDVHT
ncbi:MAG: hypothetical protein JWM78_3068 [Verrucomicrobiaceae bacterium]|nr:hypothetical protein [Verrucomicrobiaceae bacterium]